MEEEFNHKLGSVFEIFALSVLGYAIPILISQQTNTSNSISILESDKFKVLKCFSSGIILGVAMMHLLPDAVESLEDISEYSGKSLNNTNP